MGTKVELAIHLLATKHLVIASKIRNPMERSTLKHGGVEAVKTTMLKQEEIFKQQVKELHRLYSVQRMLMEEMKRQSEYSKTRILTPNEREHAWEQSGSCSGGDSETRINTKRFDFDIIRPADYQEDNSTEISNAAGPSRIKKAGLEEELCGLDLTLSIGSANKKRIKDNDEEDKRQQLQQPPCLSSIKISKGNKNLSI